MRPISLALLALAACQPSGVAVRVERLEVPAEVAIADVVAGVSTQTAFEIHNAGAGSARVELRVNDPFFVTTPSVWVPAGGAVTVRVGVSDPGYAAVQGTIDVVGPYDTATIPVSATFDLDLDDDGFAALAAGGTDCDDENFSAHPEADERCNNRDDDCNGEIDDNAVDERSWYADHDADGYGDPETSVTRCVRPMGFVAFDGDCNDGNSAVHPGATEVFYDGVDQDCAGASDYDRDGDGYDHVLFGGADCRDTDESIHPDAEELDDLVDQDCDTLVDEDFLVHGDLVITEILVNPAARDRSDGQYVEILNDTDGRTIQLRGMTVASDAGEVTLYATTMAPGDVALLCANVKPSANGGLTCAGPLPGELGDHDWLRISAEATAIDEVDWTGTEWKMLAGQALELSKLDADANDAFDAWCTAEVATTTDTGLDTGLDTGTPVDSGSPGDATASCATAP